MVKEMPLPYHMGRNVEGLHYLQYVASADVPNDQLAVVVHAQFPKAVYDQELGRCPEHPQSMWYCLKP